MLRQSFNKIARCGNNLNKFHVNVASPNHVRVLSTVTDTTNSIKSEEGPKANVTEIIGVKKAKSKPSIVKILSDLSKARLSALVVCTTGAGFICAGPVIVWDTMALTCIGTALCAASAATFNQVIEIDRDRLMNRTKMRPLPAGHVSVQNASLWGLATAAVGGGMLSVYADNTVALLGLGNILLYAGPYTYSKPYHEINTWVGAVVGAVPPIMGWLAATGNIHNDSAAAWAKQKLLNSTGAIDVTSSSDATSVASHVSITPADAMTNQIISLEPALSNPMALTNPLLLASILLVWQFPHFFALSWLHRDDYGKGGFQMVACNDLTGTRTASLIRDYTLLLSTIPIVSTLTGDTTVMFAVEGTILNAYLFHLTRQFSKNQSNANARKIFLTSLWYLPLLLIGYVFYNKNWDNARNKELEVEENWNNKILKVMHTIRMKLNHYCLHEYIIKDEESTGAVEYDRDGVLRSDNQVDDKDGSQLNNNTLNSKLKMFCPTSVLNYIKPNGNAEKDKE